MDICCSLSFWLLSRRLAKNYSSCSALTAGPDRSDDGAYERFHYRSKTWNYTQYKKEKPFTAAWLRRTISCNSCREWFFCSFQMPRERFRVQQVTMATTSLFIWANLGAVVGYWTRGGAVVEPEKCYSGRGCGPALHQISTKWASSSRGSCFTSDVEVEGDKGQAIRCHKAMSSFFLAHKRCRGNPCWFQTKEQLQHNSGPGQQVYADDSVMEGSS